jgi:hypothetical protein
VRPAETSDAAGELLFATDGVEAGERQSIMRCAAVPCLLATVATLASGCQQDPHKGELADFKEVFPRQSPTPVEQPKSVLVAQGLSPVVFQVQVPAVVHVLDLTNGQEIASASVNRGEIISVSEDSGAFVGKRRLAAGPFAPGHKYGITLDTDTRQSWQTRTEAPHPAPPPATQSVQP